jgi:hypothetical protein
VISCDLLPATDGATIGRHIIGDVFDVLEILRASGWWPDLAIFHPDCTFLTGAAAWALKDPDFDRYPGVGYHQKIQPGTLVGGARRAAREDAKATALRIASLDIEKKAAENPVGGLSAVLGPPAQIIQPNQFGDDASKRTCLWLWGLPRLNPTAWVEPRMGGMPLFGGDGGPMRWSNQTDSGQNRLSPGADRWQKRSETFAGIGAAMVAQWG